MQDEQEFQESFGQTARPCLKKKEKEGEKAFPQRKMCNPFFGHLLICVCACTCLMEVMCEGQRTILESVHSFHLVGMEDQIQVIKLSGKCLY